MSRRTPKSFDAYKSSRALSKATSVMAGSGPPGVEVAGITLIPGQRYLYAATHGMSAWRTPLPGP